MIKQPFIFLKQNFLKTIYAADGVTALDLQAAINGLTSADLPAEIVLFFSDKYGNIVSRQIDTLYLKQTNIVNMTVQYDNNGTYTDLFVLANNTADDVLIKAENTVNTTSLKITIPTTGNPATIALGAIGTTQYLLDLWALTSADYNYDCGAGNYRTMSGRLIHYGEYFKWQSKIKIENLPKAQFDLLQNEISQSQRLTVIPFKDLELSAIYDCFVNPELSFEVDRKTELYSTTLEVKEL